MILLHPPTSLLVRFAAADETLGRWKQESLRRHLAACARCRATVGRARDVASLAPGLPAPEFDLDALRTRIERRDGERVLLATGSPAAAERQRRGHGGRFLAAAAGLLAAWLLWPGDRTLDASLTHGTLVADSLKAIPGASVPLTYTPSSELAGAESLVVRVTFHETPPRGQSFEGTAILRPGDAGTFRGTLALPQRAMLAVLAVASADGRVVDDNAGQPWELLARDREGRPLRDALFTQFVVRDRDDWEKGARIVKEMVKHHPDDIRAWRFDAGNAFDLAGKAGADSVRRIYQPQLERLDAHYRDRPATQDELWEMAMFASALDDTARTRFWRGRLQREFPKSGAAAQFRVWDISLAEPDPRRRLARFDALYEEVGGESLQLLYDAFDVATRLGDSASVARWGGRVLEGRPENAWWVAGEFVKVPGLRAEGLRRLRALVAEQPRLDDADWIAAYARGAATQRTAIRHQALMQQLAIGLRNAGDFRAAYDTVSRAAALGRNPRLTRLLADLALAAGDSAGAARAWAWLGVDSRTAPAAVDSAAAQLGPWMSGKRFEEWKRAAASALREEILVTAIRRKLGNPVLVRDESGREVALDDRAGNALAVYAFVSRWCAPSVDDLASLRATATRLEAHGVPVFVIVAEQPTAAVKASYAARGWTGPLYYDEAAHARRAFRSNGTPAYFVVATSDRTARFLARRANELLAQVSALAD